MLITGCGNSNNVHNNSIQATSSSSTPHKLTRVGQEGYFESNGTLKLLRMSDNQITADTSGVTYKITSTKLFRDKLKTSNQHDFLIAAFGEDIGSTAYYVQVTYTVQNNTDYPIFIWGAGGINGPNTQYKNNEGAHDSLQGKTIQSGANMDGVLLYRADSSDKDNFKNEKMVTGLVDIKSDDDKSDIIDPVTINLIK